MAVSKMNLYEAASILFQVYTLFGLTTLSVVREKESRIFVTAKSNKCYFLQCVVLLVAITTPIVISAVFRLDDIGNDRVVNIANHYSQPLTSVVLILVSMILAYKNQEKILRVLDDMSNIDTSLKQLGILVSYNPVSFLIKRELAAIFCIFMVCTVIRIVQNYGQIYLTVINFIAFELIGLLYALILTQFTNFVYLIRTRLSVINDYLGKLQTITGSDKTRIQISISRNGSPVTRLRSQISSLKLIYGRLFYNSEAINDSFGMLNLVMCGLMFVSFVSHGFTEFGYLKDDDVPVSKFVLACRWIAIDAAKFFLLAYSSSITKEESLRCGQVLHNIETAPNDQDLRNEIKLFSLQMIHQKIEFSAYGFFPLDYTVVYNISAAVAIYLVILIQFDQANTPH